MNNITAFRNRP